MFLLLKFFFILIYLNNIWITWLINFYLRYPYYFGTFFTVLGIIVWIAFFYNTVIIVLADQQQSLNYKFPGGIMSLITNDTSSGGLYESIYWSAKVHSMLPENRHLNFQNCHRPVSFTRQAAGMVSKSGVKLRHHGSPCCPQRRQAGQKDAQADPAHDIF